MSGRGPQWEIVKVLMGGTKEGDGTRRMKVLMEYGPDGTKMKCQKLDIRSFTSRYIHSQHYTGMRRRISY